MICFWACVFALFNFWFLRWGISQLVSSWVVIFLLIRRYSNPEELIALTQQAYLCTTSCLRILHALVSSRCNFDLLHSCVLNIETWFSVLEMTEEEEKRKFDKMKRVVVATFKVVNTVLKKHVLSSKMPWYDTTETQEELRVSKVWFTNQQNYYTGDLFAKCGDYCWNRLVNMYRWV